jgi:hypothetical protein
VQRALDRQAFGRDRLARRVDEERQVLRRGLQHRPGPLVAVLGQRRVERAHEDRVVAAAGREVEHAGDLGVQRLGLDLLRGVGGEPPQVRGRELAQRGRVVAPMLGDELHQALAHRRDGMLPRLG